jgi:hypothetical protein
MANTTGPVFTQLQAQFAAQPIAGDLLTVCNDTVLLFKVNGQAGDGWSG